MDVPPVKTLLDFSDKAVVVTGSGSGLGQGIALRFAEARAQVVVHYRSSEAGARAVVKRIAEASGEAIAAQGDLTREADAARLIRQAVETFGRVDVLINNAGAYPCASVLAMTPAQWDEVINANFRFF